MPSFFSRSRPVLLALTVALSTAAALTDIAWAQQPARPTQNQPARPAQPPAQPATVVELKADPNQPAWTKVCGKDPQTQADVCYTTRDFVAENNTPVLAVAVYETKATQGPAQRQVRFLLPLTFLLQPGIRAGVDRGQPVPGRYTVCMPNGCFAEFNATEAFLTSMKRGTAMTIQVQNQAAREVTFRLPLEGFSAGFDGPPIDPRVIEEQQRQMQQELERRSEEMRRQMLQTAPAAPMAPAAPAPAAPAPGSPAPAATPRP